MRVAAPDFRNCLAASFILHSGFFMIGHLRMPDLSRAPVVEIDLTSPFIGSGPAHRAAPKRLIPQAKAPAAPVEQPLPPKAVVPVEPPKDWTLPGKDTKTFLPPPPEVVPVTKGGTVDGAGTSHLPGGSGPGDPYGDPNAHGTGGSPDIVRPKLLNLDEVLANLRKFYPERERMAGHEGTVVVDIHVGSDGAIGGVDVFQPASPLFDKAAVQVAKLMRFSPARAASGPVAAKVRKTMKFSLTD